MENYRKKNVQPMRPYVVGENLTGISVNKEDTPELGGMIAVNPKNTEDKWYVAKKFFEENYEVDKPSAVEDMSKIDGVYQCEHVKENVIRGNCVWCNLTVAEKIIDRLKAENTELKGKPRISVEELEKEIISLNCGYGNNYTLCRHEIKRIATAIHKRMEEK